MERRSVSLSQPENTDNAHAPAVRLDVSRHSTPRTRDTCYILRTYTPRSLTHRTGPLRAQVGWTLPALTNIRHPTRRYTHAQTDTLLLLCVYDELASSAFPLRTEAPTAFGIPLKLNFFPAARAAQALADADVPAPSAACPSGLSSSREPEAGSNCDGRNAGSASGSGRSGLRGSDKVSVRLRRGVGSWGYRGRSSARAARAWPRP